MSHTALDALEARVRELERKLAQVEAERDAFILEVRQQWERLYRGEPNDR